MVKQYLMNVIAIAPEIGFNTQYKGLDVATFNIDPWESPEEFTQGIVDVSLTTRDMEETQNHTLSNGRGGATPEVGYSTESQHLAGNPRE